MRPLVLFLRCLLGLLLTWGVAVRAQQPASFEKSSLAWRTALHFDPGASAPLDSLIRLYRQEKRIAELLGLYLQHLNQYPQDQAATIVLARLYVALADDRAGPLLDQALAAAPQNALLLHTRAIWLLSQHDPQALKLLAAAVMAQKDPTRQEAWLRDLIKKAAEAEREDLAAEVFKNLSSGFKPAQRLAWSRRCLELGLHQAASLVLAEADWTGLQGDEAVEAWLVQALVALAQKKQAEAARCASSALALLTPAHWRYREVLALTWQAADEPAKKQLLQASATRWQQQKNHEEVAIAHADLLRVASQDKEALTVFQESLGLLPESRVLETRVIEMMTENRDAEGLIVFLKERLQLASERVDLQTQLVRALLELGRREEGLAALKKLLEPMDAEAQKQTLLQTARHLRTRNLLGESAGVLEMALASHPDRWELRKELAEIRVALNQPAQAQKLFDGPVPESLAADLRQEVALYLITQKWWSQARLLLESGINQDVGSFETRLLLALVLSTMGDHAASVEQLRLCRESCDTPVRYAAWLAQAWAQAVEQEATQSLLESEQQNLQPKMGEKWSRDSLANLVTLAQTAAQSDIQIQAEKHLRSLLSDASLPTATRGELQKLWLDVLQAIPDRAKSLEVELQSAIRQAEPTVAMEMRLRLLLLYHQSQRLDLVTPLWQQIDPAACDDAAMLQQAGLVARQQDQIPMAIRIAERLVQLQPEESNHWVSLTRLFQQTGDEASLRASLNELRSQSHRLRLSSRVQSLIRAHLVASGWRSLSALLSADRDSWHEARAILDEMNALEKPGSRQLWLAWVRGLLATRAGDEPSRSQALKALKVQDEWVTFPDGLRLSITEARRWLSDVSLIAIKPVPASSSESRPVSSASYARAPQWHWLFQPLGKAELQRWCLTPNGRQLLAQDSASRLYALDRDTGRLIWHERLNLTAQSAAPPSGGENVSYPAEWCVSDEHICTLNPSALICRQMNDGSILWQWPLASKLPGTEGCLAYAAGRVFWWKAASGQLDALEAATGKLIWRRIIPALSRAPQMTSGQSSWLTSGISLDAGRALVWGQGSALVRLDDGSLIAQASASDEGIVFPLDLQDVLQNPASPATLIFGLGSKNSRSVLPSGVFQPVNSHALPNYGYPGMYGSSTSTSPWLLWGGDGTRLLHGDGIWLLGSAIPCAQYSVLGIPSLRASESFPRQSFSAVLPVGTAGRSLIVAQETAVLKVSPSGSISPLSNTGLRDNRPRGHPLPAVAIDGSMIGIATQEELKMVEAFTGQVLWRAPWPDTEDRRLQQARETLDSWQSLRWSSRGLTLHDNNSRSLVIEWRALMADGDFIAPVGTRSLVSVRCR